jgi:hypothetical protein
LYHALHQYDLMMEPSSRHSRRGGLSRAWVTMMRNSNGDWLPWITDALALNHLKYV